MKQSDNYSVAGSLARTIFGAVMIVIYVGMGVLFLINFFDWIPKWDWLRYGGGVVFIIYGIWRAIRQIRGIDSNI